jgi:hypothetical protein
LESPDTVGRLVEELPDHAPFVDEIRDGFHPADLLARSVLPAVLLAVFALPMESRRGLAFEYGNPTPFTAFTANYVHLTASHPLSNLGAYLALGPTAYLLALSTDSRNRFYLALTAILVVFPVPLTYLNLAVPRSGIVVGFSGLLMAILGYELVEFARYTGEYFTDDFGVENAPRSSPRDSVHRRSTFRDDARGRRRGYLAAARGAVHPGVPAELSPYRRRIQSRAQPAGLFRVIGTRVGVPLRVRLGFLPAESGHRGRHR